MKMFERFPMTAKLKYSIEYKWEKKSKVKQMKKGCG